MPQGTNGNNPNPQQNPQQNPQPATASSKGWVKWLVGGAAVLALAIGMYACNEDKKERAAENDALKREMAERDSKMRARMDSIGRVAREADARARGLGSDLVDCRENADTLTNRLVAANDSIELLKAQADSLQAALDECGRAKVVPAPVAQPSKPVTAKRPACKKRKPACSQPRPTRPARPAHGCGSHGAGVNQNGAAGNASNAQQNPGCNHGGANVNGNQNSVNINNGTINNTTVVESVPRSSAVATSTVTVRYRQCERVQSQYGHGR